MPIAMFPTLACEWGGVTVTNITLYHSLSKAVAVPLIPTRVPALPPILIAYSTYSIGRHSIPFHSNTHINWPEEHGHMEQFCNLQLLLISYNMVKLG